MLLNTVLQQIHSLLTSKVQDRLQNPQLVTFLRPLPFPEPVLVRHHPYWK